MTPRSLHRYTMVTAGCTFLLLIAGALVTSNDAGLAVPDWPLSYGTLFPPMVGGIRWEHGHRLVAGFVGLLTLVLAIWYWRREPRRWVRWLAVAALGLILAQAILGGITVLFYLPTAVSVGHATLAQLFFSTIVCLALLSSPWWQSERPQLDDTGSPRLRSLVLATAAAIFLQLVLGAALRHKGVGLAPHLIGAAIVTAMVVWTARVMRKRYGQVAALRRSARLLHVLLGVQLVLGGASYVLLRATREAPQPLPLVVTVTVAHVVVGALLLASSAATALACFRMLRPAGSLPLASRAERAAI